MKLPLLNFSALVGNAAAAVQGSARQLIDLSVGSTLRAVLEANASLALWMQWLIVLVLQTTRAATSTGIDLDTWVGDFSLVRLPASPAAGVVQFARFVGGLPALIPAGTQVRTADGSQSFQVVADAGNPAWRPDRSGYALLPEDITVSVPVQAVIAGTAGNVQAGSVTLVAAALPGVDTVTNTEPMAGGVDAESDAALRIRFQMFLDSRARATPLAIGSAILSQRQGLSYAIAENVAPDGSVSMGSFVATVDDGTGAPSPDVLAAAAAAIETMRPVGTRFSVRGPTTLSVPVSLSVTSAPGYSRATVIAAVAQGITSFVNSLPIGASLIYSRLIQIAFDASPGVANVSALLVNGGLADIAPGPGGVVKAATVQVS